MSGKRAPARGAAAAKRPRTVASDADTDDEDGEDDHGLTMDCPEDPQDAPDSGRPALAGRSIDPPARFHERAHDRLVTDHSETPFFRDQRLARGGVRWAPPVPVSAPPPPPHAPAFAATACLDAAALVVSWSRPPAALAAVVESLERPLSVQVVDVDYYTDAATDLHETRAVIRLFGVTSDGVSVLMHVPDFQPYFYVRVPGLSKDPADDARRVGSALINALNAELLRPEHAWDYVSQAVLAVLPLERRSIRNFSFVESEPFLKIVLALPSLVAPCRQLLEDGLLLILPPRSDGEGGCSAPMTFDTFESNCAFALRFMADMDIVGCGWVSAAGGLWAPRAPQGYTSRCQLEVDVAHADLEAHPTTDPEWMAVAPMRLLSFDIECMGRDGIFPEAEHDPVIQIANYVQLQGEASPVVAVIFTLDTCSSTGCGAQVLSFDTEAALLRAWAAFVRCADPDLLTGYNIVNFDLPYLLDRAQALGLADFPYLGRVTATKTRAKEKVFQSKQTGARKSKEINVEGCVVFDAFVIFQRDERLSSLSLNFVSSHFLGDQKEDVPHTAISGLQRGSADDRRRLAVYCLKDARLPLRLLEKRMKVVNYVEMARVTGVPLSYLLTRGQQIKVMSMLYRKCRPLGLVLPVARDRVEGEKYEGATVIEPVKGFYKDHPIATLDFASLYPSIMQAHNLCYSTLLRRQDVARLPPADVTTSPTGDCFVKATRRKGVLPMILEELLAARKQAKKDMKAAQARADDAAYAVYDGRQLALKVSANSVYGCAPPRAALALAPALAPAPPPAPPRPADLRGPKSANCHASRSAAPSPPSAAR
jgi:DNA polymerase delta subunit 1